MRIPFVNVSSVISNGNESSLELDTHADTCAIGKDALIIMDHNRPVNVQGYDPTLGTKQYQTASAALAYTHPGTGQVYHLVIHQGIFIPELDHCLLCPFQCRVNDIQINDVPKFLTRNPTVATHSICVPDPDRHDRELYLPLALSGVTSYLSISKPTVEEFESGNFARIELTSLDLTWDPGDTTYATQEDDITDSHGEIINDPAARGPKTLVINSLNSMAVDAADITDDDNFGNVLESNVSPMITFMSTDAGPEKRVP